MALNIGQAENHRECSQLVDNKEDEALVNDDEFFGDEEDEEDFSSSDDDEIYGCQALAFDPSQLSHSVGIPVNGHDYLKLVKDERDKLPPVSSAPKPQSPIKKDETPTNQSGRDKGCNKFIDLERQDEIIENFMKLRQKIEAIRAKVPRRPTNVDDNQLDEKQYDKCLSRAERRANSLIKTMSLGHQPELSAILKKSQMEIHLTLEKLADLGEGTLNYSTLHADWIYSLMAALSDPIEPDICSTLRRLAKLCILKRDGYSNKSTVHNVNEQSSNRGEVRERVDEVEEEEFISCLLIICIVRIYFGQSDLK